MSGEWHTLRNPNALWQVSVSGTHIVVPVLRSRPELAGFAVIDVSELSPQFKTAREAQLWVDAQEGGEKHEVGN